MKKDASPLPTQLYTAAQVRMLDHCAIEQHQLSASLLMKRAAEAALARLLSQWPKVASIHVFCGAGNNGGDGYALAALAAQRLLTVTIWQLAPADKLTGAALAAYHYACQEQVPIQPFSPVVWQRRQSLTHSTATLPNVIVDALLGTGAVGPLRPVYADAVEVINTCDWPVLAIDIPSGVNADNGHVASVAVKADATVSFIGLKIGLFTAKGRIYSGRSYFSDLAVPTSIYSAVSDTVTRFQLDDILDVLPPRPVDAHKRDCGHLVVIGGDYGYGGAPLMAAEMALRSGAGMVSIATHGEHIGAILARRPELMATAVASAEKLSPLLQRSDALVIGPGIGRSTWSKNLLRRAIDDAGLPMVLDADALNLLASGELSLNTSHPRWVLTPHPGEAARLLATSSDKVQADRVQAARDIQARYGGVIVLKGPGTLILDLNGDVGICDHGNAGMATAGMGDILAGLVGSLIAQGLDLNDSARLGVCLHAAAADDLMQSEGRRGLLATDIINAVRALMNNYNCPSAYPDACSTSA